ncbi:CCA tRNA nucleotidyltransferase [Altererythrobacter aurantiacus]|uniref:CCA tRNA nucleotidyltransferase n=1 Tax=Parapontixanthobacter aurantiacus TaxID=1463599 RepID=A0A844ZAH0_9SPHN|nr:CCA tRNA nucleotidyltransferase [Parapontixanthobacter aurantiacus]MXO84788.1 CCA tRNA nucleotidyltransferase [Parapontixanthobacter aurantiacus]
MAETFPTVLPAADWTRNEYLLSLAETLGPDNIRWVGGAVRDTLSGIVVKDVDAATPLLPDTVIGKCREAGIRTVPTGIEHGTVTAIFPGLPVEITTLRRDVATDGRRATVAFASDWREDAARRDFTINALYAHPHTLAISDYFGGLEDLAAERVRFIGDARQRIAEDHLRILRYFRFRARYGGWETADEETEAAIAEMAPTLKGLSRERIAMELLAILALPDPFATVCKMRELGVLSIILPEAGKREFGVLERLVKTERANDVAPSDIRRLAALLPPIPSVAESVAARLRLSKAQRARLSTAAARRPDDAARARGLAFEEGVEEATDRLLLEGASLAPLVDWDVPLFPLKGGEIIARGVAPGPGVARLMQTLKEEWIAAGFPEKGDVIAMLDRHLAKDD